MKTTIAIAVAAMFAAGSAFAQNVQPTKAPVQVAQAGGGMAAGAGGATGGVVGTTLSATGVVAVAAGTALALGASGSTSTTNH